MCDIKIETPLILRQNLNYRKSKMIALERVDQSMIPSKSLNQVAKEL